MTDATRDALAVPVLTTPSRDLEGVGGWLAWFILGQGVVVLMQLVGIKAVWEPFTNGTFALSSTFPILAPLLFMESAFHLGQIALPCVGFWLVYTKSRSTRGFWVAYLILMFMYAAIDLSGGYLFLAQVERTVGADAAQDVEKAMKGAMFENMRLALFSVVWALYWMRSVRVRVTFTPAQSA